MKLYSNFHDYYDTAIGYGIDNNVHYNRHTEEVEIKFNGKFPISSRFQTDCNRVTRILIGFCGELFPVVKIEKLDNNCGVIDCIYVYAVEELLLKDFQTVKQSKSNLWYFPTYTQKSLKQFLTDGRKHDDSLFLEHKTPIWVSDLVDEYPRFILNPKLESYQFYRIKDAFTTFQEISMYLSNVLLEQKEIAAVEDKYRIEQHGFDSKTSFRKGKKK
jgi:hypothetical protein